GGRARGGGADQERGGGIRAAGPAHQLRRPGLYRHAAAGEPARRGPGGPGRQTPAGPAGPAGGGGETGKVPAVGGGVVHDRRVLSGRWGVYGGLGLSPVPRAGPSSGRSRGTSRRRGRASRGWRPRSA